MSPDMCVTSRGTRRVVFGSAQTSATLATYAGRLWHFLSRSLVLTVTFGAPVFSLPWLTTIPTIGLLRLTMRTNWLHT